MDYLAKAQGAIDAAHDDAIKRLFETVLGDLAGGRQMPEVMGIFRRGIQNIRSVHENASKVITASTPNVEGTQR